MGCHLCANRTVLPPLYTNTTRRCEKDTGLWYRGEGDADRKHYEQLKWCNEAMIHQCEVTMIQVRGKGSYQCGGGGGRGRGRGRIGGGDRG